MKKKLRSLLFLLIVVGLPFSLFSQSLSPERVAKIKSCTVKIVLDNQVIGTGFFIDNRGTLLTCWHVIKSSIIRMADKTILKPSFIEYSNGKRDSVAIPPIMEKISADAVSFDFCVLIPKKQLSQTSQTPFLKLGSFANIQEGEEVYTCGYPLGMQQQFISKGIVSTKYLENDNFLIDVNGKTTTIPRNQALLDMTLNKGNSGGAIVKIGKTIDEDEVIGIADFIINPIGNKGDDLIKHLNANAGAIKIQGVDPNAMFSLLATFINSSSNGISGCVAIDHFLSTASKLKN